MKLYVTAEWVLATTGGALMPVVNPATAAPYIGRGVATLLTRKVTMTPDRDSGTARWTYGPWREVRTASAGRAA